MVTEGPGFTRSAVKLHASAMLRFGSSTANVALVQNLLLTLILTQIKILRLSECNPHRKPKLCSPGDGSRGDAVAADLALRRVHQRRRHLGEARAEAGHAARRRRRGARRLQRNLRRRPSTRLRLALLY